MGSYFSNKLAVVPPEITQPTIPQPDSLSWSDEPTIIPLPPTPPRHRLPPMPPKRKKSRRNRKRKRDQM